MKCPRCQHDAGDSAQLECVHCGSTFARGQLEELEHVEYLRAWLAAHQAELGGAGERLLAETEARRGMLRAQLGLGLEGAERPAGPAQPASLERPAGAVRPAGAGRPLDAAQAGRELALWQAVAERAAGWARQAGLEASASRAVEAGLIGQVERASSSFRSFRSGRGSDAAEAAAARAARWDLEILDFALQNLAEWAQWGPGALDDAGRQALRRALVEEQAAEAARLGQALALRNALLELLPRYQKTGSISGELAAQLKKMFEAQVEYGLALLAGRHAAALPAGPGAPTRQQVIAYAIQSLPGWAASLRRKMDDRDVQKFATFLAVEQQSLALQQSPAPGTGAFTAPTGQAAVPPSAAKAPAETSAATGAAAAPEKTAAPERAALKMAAPKPQTPLIDWGKLSEKVVQAAVSGALLRGLLYLGAFMIVISLTILVVRFWDIFPALVQVLFIFSVPTIFYSAGWFLRARLKLPQAGDTITGIGALLVAVDFAALYQLARLPIPINTYWLVTGAICALAYAITAWRVPGLFFDSIALLGGVNVLVALTRSLNLPLEWSTAAVTAGCAGMAAAASWMASGQETGGRETAGDQEIGGQETAGDQEIGGQEIAGDQEIGGQETAGDQEIGGQETAGDREIGDREVAGGQEIGDREIAGRVSGSQANAGSRPTEQGETLAAARYLPQILIPLSLAACLFVPGSGAPGGAAPGQAVTFGLAALAYGLLAWRFLRSYSAHAAVWVSLGAVGFGLRAAHLPLDWFGAAAALLAVVYSLVPRLAGGRFAEEDPQQRTLSQRPLRQRVLRAALPAAFALLGLSILLAMLTGIFSAFWPGVAALALAAGGLGFWAYWFRRPLLAFLAAGLFWLPLGLAADHLLRQGGFTHDINAWLAVVWVGLALVYLGGAVLLKGRAKYAAALHLWAQILALAAMLMVWLDFSQNGSWSSAAQISAQGGILLVYLAAALLHHSGRHPGLSGRVTRLLPGAFGQAVFLWPLALLLPVWANSLLSAAGLAPEWRGAALAGLGLAYLPVGQGLRRGGAEPPWTAYRLPLHAAALVVSAAGCVAAISEPNALLTGLYLAVILLAGLAGVYHSALAVGAAALLFILPFQLSLNQLKVVTHAQSLAYALLASLGYMPVGMWLEKAGGAKWAAQAAEKEPQADGMRFAWPVYVTGYGLAGLALAASLLGWYETYAVNLPWVSALTPALVTGLCIFSLYWFRQKRFAGVFAWAGALTLALAFWQGLAWARLPGEDYPAAWAGLAYLYLLASAGLRRSQPAQQELRTQEELRTQRARAARPLLDWLQPTRLPLLVGCAALGGLALLLTAEGTALALWMGPASARQPALILAQALVAGLAALAAGLYRSRWPLYLAPWLAWLPVSVLAIGYGDRLLGRPLSSAELGLVTCGLGSLALLAGFLLDRKPERYAHGLYLGGYLLAGLGLLRALPDRLDALYGLGWCILLTLGSHLLVHFGRHAAFDDLLALVFGKGTASRASAVGETGAWSTATGDILYRGARALFLFLASYAFPVWLALLLETRQVNAAWQGLALALLAPLYLAAGLYLRHIKQEYTWPLYSAAYALTAVGAALALPERALAPWVLALDALVYAASAYLFRQPFWLYLANLLVPGIALLALDNAHRLEPAWLAGTFMALAYLDLAAGRGLDFWQRSAALITRRRPGRSVSAYALPFYLTGGALCAAALAAGSLGSRYLAIDIYLAGAALSAICAWTFQQTLFLYPAAWLAAVPYTLAVRLTPLKPDYYGLAWLPLIVASILLGRFVFHRKPLDLRRWAGLAQPAAGFNHPAMPFYLLGYGLSLGMLALSTHDAPVQSLAFAAAGTVYLGAAALFRRAAWLYPGLLAGHLAMLGYLNLHPGGGRVSTTALGFLAAAWLMALVGYGFSRLRPTPAQNVDGRQVFHLWGWELDIQRLPALANLAGQAWARPFFVFTLLDILTAQTYDLGSAETSLIAAAGTALLLGLFATLWQDRALPYGALGFGLLAAGSRLAQVSAGPARMLAWFAGIGFGLYLAGRLAEWLMERYPSGLRRLGVWVRPLEIVPMLLTGLAALGAPLAVFADTLAASAALAFAGATWLAIAYHGRHYRLGYLAVAMLEAAWALVLVAQDVRQPQLYAIPAGLYFSVMAVLERRQGRGVYAWILEGLGMAVLLVTTFIQSLNGAQGFPYFVLLLVEGVLAVWYGTVQRQRVSFFAGLGASVLNVIAQIVVLVRIYEVNRWFIILGVGLVLVALAVFVERRRERLLAQAQEWRESLASWN